MIAIQAHSRVEIIVRVSAHQYTYPNRTQRVGTHCGASARREHREFVGFLLCEAGTRRGHYFNFAAEYVLGADGHKGLHPAWDNHGLLFGCYSLADARILSRLKG